MDKEVMEHIEKLRKDDKILDNYLLSIENEITSSPLCDDMDILQEKCPVVYDLIDGSNLGH